MRVAAIAETAQKQINESFPQNKTNNPKKAMFPGLLFMDREGEDVRLDMSDINTPAAYRLSLLFFNSKDNLICNINSSFV